MRRPTGPGRVEVETQYSSANSLNAVLYNFDFDSDELKQAHADFLLKEAVPRLRDASGYAFLIGSASRVGEEAYNLSLSDRRVNRVAKFLKEHGVAEHQMQLKAVGESLSFGPAPNNERHRAVVVLVVPRKKKAPTRIPKPVTAGPRYEPYQYMKPEKYQFQLVVRTFIPHASFMGFMGDNRGFSMSPHATYRTGMFIVFDLSTGRVTETPAGNSTGTRRNVSDPKAYADVRVKVEHWQGDRGRILLSVHMEGSDPLVPGAPDVDTDIVMTAFLKDGNLFTTGEVIGDAFPSTEAFLRDYQRTGHELLYFPTPYSGSGVIRLLGAGTRRLGRFKAGITLDEKARFIGTSPWPG